VSTQSQAEQAEIKRRTIKSEERPLESGLTDAAVDPAAATSVLPVRLNVGCGSTTPEGWINIDNSPTMWLAQRPVLWRFARRLRLVPADMDDAPRWAARVLLANAVRRLPLATASVDAIYASHFLEHLPRDDAVLFLREARRLLRADGLIRIVVPDLASIVDHYLQARRDGDARAADEMFENLWVVDKGLMRYPHWFRPLKAWLRTDVHRWMYDEASLRALLEEAGFIEILARGYLETEIPGLSVVESAVRLQDAACLEARQPPPIVTPATP
jgi:predicted SAM-dependent methyltransferase